MKTITVECENCKKSFEMKMGEYKRHIKNNFKRKYCSRQCRIDHVRLCPEVVVHDGLKKWWNDEKNFEHCRKINEAQSHERRRTTMGWKEFLRRARNSKKKLELEIDDLKTIWEKQEGRCPYTGWELILPTCQTRKTPQTASMDRIDSSKGYTKDNIQFVCVMANYAKNNFEEDCMREFCEAIYENCKKSKN
jgi:hypothetical protein